VNKCIVRRRSAVLGVETQTQVCDKYMRGTSSYNPNWVLEFLKVFRPVSQG